MQNLSTPTSNREPVRPNAAGAFPRLADGAHSVALGNGRQYEVVIVRGRTIKRQLGEFPTLVAVIGKGAYWFSQFLHGSYACEKLGIPRDDADNLADFINDQLSINAARQGKYDPNTTADWEQSLYPVEVFTAFSLAEDGDEVARVCVSAMTEHGTAMLGAETVKAAKDIAEWAAKKLFFGEPTPPPAVLENHVIAGRTNSPDVATLGVEDYFAAQHAKRVKGAL